MKKKLLILIPFLMVITLIFFLYLKNNQSKELFYLNEEYYGITALEEVNSDDIKALEKSKKSFVVLVYDPLCSTSFDFSKNVELFINNNKIRIYKILFADIKNTDIANYVKYCPSAVIYHNGKVATYLDSSLEDDTIYYESEKGFGDWLARYIILK
jgi:hypothetical protein